MIVAFLANALKTFEQIPASSRYQFYLMILSILLWHFIRGPVCKGQIALNVINDHFGLCLWSKFDLSLQDKYFYMIIFQISLFQMNMEDPSLFKTFRVIDNYELSKNIIQIEQKKFINSIFQKVYQWMNLERKWDWKWLNFWLFIGIWFSFSSQRCIWRYSKTLWWLIILYLKESIIHL